ncbi:PPE domain-containing protein [Nocardia xishanensis]
MAVHGTDGRAITNPENAQSFSHTEIKQAADRMNPTGLEGAHAGWSALSAAVGTAGEQFGSALQRVVEQRWEGAAADAAVRGVRAFVTQLGELGAALGRQSEPLSAAGSAAAQFKAAIPDVTTGNGNSTAPAERNAREEQARDDMNRLYIRPYGVTAPRIPTLPSPVGPSGGGSMDGLLGGNGRPWSSSGAGRPDGTNSVTDTEAAEGVSGPQRDAVVGSSTSSDHEAEGQTSTGVQSGAGAHGDRTGNGTHPGAGVHPGANDPIGSGVQTGNGAQPETGAQSATGPQPETPSEGDVPPEHGTQPNGGDEPESGAPSDNGAHGSAVAKPETTASQGDQSNQEPSSGDNAPREPHADPDTVAAQSVSSPTNAPSAPPAPSLAPSVSSTPSPAPVFSTPTTPITPATPLGAAPVASPPSPFAPAALHETSARPTAPFPLGPTNAPPTPPPSPGSSVPAQPAATPNTAPASGGPARLGAPGTTGYASVMPSAPRTRTEEDGEHRTARYLRSEEHGQELIGETPKTVPPALGAD